MSYRERLHNVIPGGAHTYSRGDDQFPSNAPEILLRGSGAYVWDKNGHKFLDYGMGLRSVTIGYSDQRVNSSAIEAIEAGNNLTRASYLELEAAELFVNTISSADMVKFCKNGSNATTAAAKLARAYTGKKYICVPRQQPFFSFDDWFIGSTVMDRGVPAEHKANTLTFDYNDIESLKKLFDEYPGQIAAVMLEPATNLVPCPSFCDEIVKGNRPCNSCVAQPKNFLRLVKDLANRNGALFILDEMITGFRWGLNGAQGFYDIEPDISTFGKGMANGFSLAAVAGKREIMKLGGILDGGSQRVFLLSSTHGSEMVSLGAFKKVIEIYKDEKVCDGLWQYGGEFRKKANGISMEMGLLDFFEFSGPDIGLVFSTKDAFGVPCYKMRTLFMQEMVKNSVLMPWVAFSQSHGREELDLTMRAIQNSLEVYKCALKEGVHKYLNGPETRPVFRKFN